LHRSAWHNLKNMDIASLSSTCLTSTHNSMSGPTARKKKKEARDTPIPFR
jgi:hypothetical protein